MERNSTTLFLASPGAVTPIPWVNNAPDFTGFTEPTLSVLQSSWQNFLDGGQEMEIVPDPEPIPEPSEPDWTTFNTVFLDDASWQSVAATLPTDLRYGIVGTSANGNAVGLQSAVNIAKGWLDGQGTPLSQSIKDEWQAIADQYFIEVIF